MTDHDSLPAQLRFPPLLATTRAQLELTLMAFADVIAARGGPRLTRQRLSRLERETATLSKLDERQIAEALVAVPELPAALLASWRTLLGRAEHAPGAGQSQRFVRERLTVYCQHMADNPRWDAYRAATYTLGVDLDEYRIEAIRRLELQPPAAGWAAMPGDNVNIVDAGTNRIIVVDHGETLVARCLLRNVGEVAWNDRLLVRLGPVAGSSLAFTPPVLPLPDTPPGNECRLVIPGRAPWLPNLTTVVFAMTFPDGTPAMPGSLQLTVDAREVTRLRENVPVSWNPVLRLRRRLAT